MSIELYVYSAAAGLLAPADLTGDSESINWNLALFRDFTALEPAVATDACVVVGWQSDADTGPAMHAALSARDREQLDAFYRDDALAVVDLAAEHPYAADPEDLAEWKRLGVRRAHLERVQKARARYTLRTGASRNELSAELQHQLWLLVGVLTDGLCEDPQEGKFIDAEEADIE